MITSCTTSHGSCEQSTTCTVRGPLRKVNESIAQVLRAITISQMTEKRQKQSWSDFRRKRFRTSDGGIQHGYQATIYMDYHATTPVDQRVVDTMLPYFHDKFGMRPAATTPSAGRPRKPWRTRARRSPG